MPHKREPYPGSNRTGLKKHGSNNIMSPLDAYEGSIEVTAALSVTDADALSDSRWFAEQPTRLFRVRPDVGGLWLIRRRSQGPDTDVYLRTFSRMIALASGDSDGELAVLWFGAVYPNWPPERCRKWTRRVLKKGKADEHRR